MPRSSLKASASEDEEALAELQALDLALAGMVLEESVRRSRLLIADAAARFVAGQERLATGKKIKVRRGAARRAVLGCRAAGRLVCRLAALVERLVERLGPCGARSCCRARSPGCRWATSKRAGGRWPAPRY